MPTTKGSLGGGGINFIIGILDRVGLIINVPSLLTNVTLSRFQPAMKVNNLFEAFFLSNTLLLYAMSSLMITTILITYF